MKQLIYVESCKDFHFYQSDIVCFVTKQIKADNISFETTLSMQGCYVFWDRIEKLCFDDLSKYLANELPDLSFLWIENPSKNYSVWHTQQICCKINSSKRMLLPSQYVGYTQYKYQFPLSSYIEWSQETQEFILYAQKGATSYLRTSKNYSGYTAGLSTIKFVEGGTGQINFTFHVDESQSADMFKVLDICIRYQSIRELTPTHLDDIYTTSLYPSLVTNADLDFSVQWNLCKPLNKDMSYMKFAQSEISIKNLFHSIYGKEITAKTTQKSKLVFQKCVEYRVHNSFSNKVSHNYHQQYYLTLEGDFDLQNEDNALLCGLNGDEYLKKDTNEHNTISFQFDNDSFVQDGQFKPFCQTSYVSFKEPIPYYSQPQKSDFFTNDAEAKYVLKDYAYPISTLKAEQCIAYFNHSYCDSHEKLAEKNLEIEQLLEKQRHRLMGVPTSRSKKRTSENPTRIVSTKGILLEISPDYNWNWMGIATDGQNDTPSTRFTRISKALSLALQQEQLFFVLADKTILPEKLSIPYKVTEKSAQEIKTENSSIDITSLQGNDYENQTTFSIALKPINPQYVSDAVWLNIILKHTADFSVMAEGWYFQLSPHSFRSVANTETIILLKYYDGMSLYDMAKNKLNVFSNSEESNEKILTILDTALEKAHDEKENVKDAYRDFVKYVTEPSWCGILCLNVPVICSKLDPALSILVDTIDQENFYAHHIAIEKNEVFTADKTLKLKPSAISGVIDYEQEFDNQRSEEKLQASFCTTKLMLRIKNTQIKDFHSVSEITVNSCFHADAHKKDTSSGNSMIVDGIYQKSGEVKQYMFSLREKTSYVVANSCIEQMDITAVQLFCEGTKKKFSFIGGLHFNDNKDCDLLGYGEESETGISSLLFEDLILLLDKNKSDFYYDNLCFLIKDSIARKNAFINRFSANFVSLTYCKNTKMQDLGFENLQCPIRQGTIEGDFYLMIHQIDLGGLGDLSDNLPIKLQIGIAWDVKPKDTEEKEPNIYVGMRFSDKKGKKNIFEMQSILKLQFKSIVLKVGEEKKELNYQLQLKDFKISFASFSFPPGKNTIFIFANPENTKQLGWYAAYIDIDEED